MKKWKQYLLCILFVGGMAAFYLWSWDFATGDRVTRLRLICDGFAVPGVLLLCLGALIWASSLGALDGLGYSLRMAYGALVPGKRLQKEERYADYVARKRQKACRGYGVLLISGGFAVAISMVFLVLYYMS